MNWLYIEGNVPSLKNSKQIVTIGRHPRLLPSKTHQKYAKKLMAEFAEHGIRCKYYEASDTLGKRIREAEMKKIPYMAVIGDKEVKGKSLAIRDYKTKKQDTYSAAKFLKQLKDEVTPKQ